MRVVYPVVTNDSESYAIGHEGILRAAVLSGVARAELRVGLPVINESWLVNDIIIDVLVVAAGIGASALAPLVVDPGVNQRRQMSNF